MNRIHGSAVSHSDRGVLIIGSAGAGKSSLALQLIAQGASLVADDSVEISNISGKIAMLCPEPIRGIIEARNIGLLSVNFVDQAGLEIVVDMDKTVSERLPVQKFMPILGVGIPVISGKNVPNLGAVIWCLLTGGRILPTE